MYIKEKKKSDDKMNSNEVAEQKASILAQMILLRNKILNTRQKRKKKYIYITQMAQKKMTKKLRESDRRKSEGDRVMVERMKGIKDGRE